MALTTPSAGPSTDELLTARFNQDHTCLAVGTRRGYQIFACEPFASCHACTDGAGIAVLEMLFSSSLVALVSAGERPGDSPRRLRLWNTRSNASICDLNFSCAAASGPSRPQRADAPRPTPTPAAAPSRAQDYRARGADEQGAAARGPRG